MENTPFLVSSHSIIASENVSGRISGENFRSPGNAIFTNPEESQSERVPILPIRRGPIFANPRGGVLFLPIRRGSIFANPEGSQFCQSGGVLFLAIRRGPIFANLEGSQLCQSGSFPISPIRRGPIFANPEGYYFCQSGRLLFCQDLGRQKKSK